VTEHSDHGERAELLSDLAAVWSAATDELADEIISPQQRAYLRLTRLRAIVDHPAFRAGRLHTGFLEEHFAGASAAPCPPAEAFAAAAAALHRSPTAAPGGRTALAADAWTALGGWRLGR